MATLVAVAAAVELTPALLARTLPAMEAGVVALLVPAAKAEREARVGAVASHSMRTIHPFP